MNSSTVKSFAKKLGCPSSTLLLSFSSHTLAPEINLLVRHHLASCDFCYCEIPLLSFYTVPRKGETRTPELPVNLRALAESILLGNRSARAKSASTGEDPGINNIEVEDIHSSN
jgi:hypothetical protein